MKQIKCEMCGSADLVKQDGMYVCQTCGTKYSIEEARKLMVEVDNTKKLANLYERARKSLEVDDLEHAAEYFKQILDENPNDWEAYFYTYLGEFSTYTNAQAGSVAAKLGNTIPAAYDMAIETEDKVEAAKRIETITYKTVDKLAGIAATAISLLKQYEGGNILSPTGKVHFDLYQNMRPLAQGTIIACVDAIDPIDNKLQEIYKGNHGISETKILDCIIHAREVKYNIADVTFLPSSATTEKMIKDKCIQKYSQNIENAKKEIEVIRKKDTEKYWEEHSAERQQLESEKVSLQTQISELNGQMEGLPEVAEISSLESKLDDLYKRKASLGLFKGKAKKELQAQIDSTVDAVADAKDRKYKSSKLMIDKVWKLQARIKEIDNELTKDR